jgi:Cu/Ag efflux pump CusA
LDFRGRLFRPLTLTSLIAVRAAFLIAYTSVGPTVGPLRVQ